MKREAIRTDKAPKAIGPYEQALKVDGWVFTSGQIALDPKSTPSTSRRTSPCARPWAWRPCRAGP
jgi:enamine deaminase RidA (YjgF/YER057c/UK114 family)